MILTQVSMYLAPFIIMLSFPQAESSGKVCLII